MMGIRAQWSGLLPGLISFAFCYSSTNPFLEGGMGISMVDYKNSNKTANLLFKFDISHVLSDGAPIEHFLLLAGSHSL